MGAAAVGGVDTGKPRLPAPDLASMLLDNRIVYLGIPLLSATTELIISELIYLQYCQREQPIFMYINSTGCTRADGEPIGFETEGTAVYDTMKYLESEIITVGVGLAYGH